MAVSGSSSPCARPLGCSAANPGPVLAGGWRMRKIMIASVLALVLGVAAPVRADITLTSAVAAAWFPRSVDAELHSIAHQRVLQISACSSCMNHDGMRAGTAEVIGYNGGY